MSDLKFNERPLVVIDFETTGIDPYIHDIIEIGALRVNPKTLDRIGSFESKIKIKNFSTVQPVALQVNGYTPEAWRTAADDIADVLPGFAEWVGDGVLCAWNITFEDRFLNEAYHRSKLYNPFLERRFSHKLDIPSMVYHRFGSTLESLSYDDIANKFGIAPEVKPHRAINGAKHNLEVLRALRGRPVQYEVG